MEDGVKGVFMSVKFISHRGESFDAPENTIPAFALSQERKTHGMECDIHFTSDGYIVCSHDESTKRTGNVEKVIAETPLAELQKVDVSYGKKAYSPVSIPLFADTLPFLGEEREYYVEIKNDLKEMPAALVKLLEEKKIPKKNITMISFDIDVVKIYKELFPDRRALYLVGGNISAEELLERLQYCKADGVDIGQHESHDAAYVKKIHEAGYAFAVWTIDDLETAGKYMEMGADAITSNRAAFLMEKF